MWSLGHTSYGFIRGKLLSPQYLKMKIAIAIQNDELLF
jgi:hypothetical protein